MEKSNLYESKQLYFTGIRKHFLKKIMNNNNQLKLHVTIVECVVIYSPLMASIQWLHYLFTSTKSLYETTLSPRWKKKNVNKQITREFLNEVVFCKMAFKIWCVVKRIITRKFQARISVTLTVFFFFWLHRGYP